MAVVQGTDTKRNVVKDGQRELLCQVNDAPNGGGFFYCVIF